MSALQNARSTNMPSGGDPVPKAFTIGLAINAKVWEGAIVCVDTSTGYGTQGKLSSTLIALGRAEAPPFNALPGYTAPGYGSNVYDNTGTGATNGGITCTYRQGVFTYANSAAGADLIAATDIGADAFIVDDQTVAKTNGTNTRSRAGKIMGVDSFGNVQVHIGVSFALPNGTGATSLSFDVASAGALALGPTVATSVVLGKAGVPAQAPGGLDQLTATALAIGATNATSVALGKAAVPASAATGATAGFDCQTAAPLSVGGTTATAVVLGKAGTAAGNGVRNGASRSIIVNKPTSAVDATGGITATVTQVLEGGIFTAATAVAVTLPTAQGAGGIVQALPGAVVGDVIEIQFCMNHATNTLTLTAGAGSTVFGIATNTNGSRIWRGRVTAITSGSETITWY